MAASGENGLAYYNEIDEQAAQWLDVLIARGLIAPGIVDRRSIADVHPDELRGFTQCHFFAGIGGWSLGLRRAGVPDDFPVWTGSCPCQPFSLAGRQKGFDDERHLWPVWRELLRKRRPAIAFGEQVASASDWLRLVRGDLETMGYAVGAMPVEAASAGADHLRDRFWFVASADDVADRSSARCGDAENDRAASSSSREGSCETRAAAGVFKSQRGGGAFDLADTERGLAQRRRGSGQLPVAAAAAQGEGCERQRGRRATSDHSEGIGWVLGADGKARRVKSGIRLLADGIPGRVGLLRGFGNAIDPRPAAAFIRASIEALGLAPALGWGAAL